jgi:hypothetical protein
LAFEPTVTCDRGSDGDLFVQDGATRDILLNAADAAMYKAKSKRNSLIRRSGSNRCREASSGRLPSSPDNTLFFRRRATLEVKML